MEGRYIENILRRPERERPRAGRNRIDDKRTRHPTAPGGRIAMSTAGKVLSVIVTLMAIIWVVLSAGVAQLNRNWAQRLDEDKKAIEKLEGDVLANESAVVTTRDQASQEQSVAENELAVRESEIVE